MNSEFIYPRLRKFASSVVIAGFLYFSEIASAGQNYNLSLHGIGLIKKFEGFSTVKYREPNGGYSIGYGHFIRVGENLEKITEKEAEAVLKKDLLSAEKAVERNVRVPLNQGQYDALVSFTYNLGEGNLQKSGLLKKINSKDYRGASMEFIKWSYSGGKKSKGLEARRKKEAEIFKGK